MESATILSIFLGVGLAASAGFRVFLPLFVLSTASYFDVIQLNESWAWVSTLPVMITLGIAMLAEIIAYYIPFVDNLLDTIATPLAAIAGTVIMASTILDFDPMLTWGLAIIAGGGTATAMQGMTSMTRLASSVKTAGAGNSVVSTAETGTALTLSSLAVFLPIVALIIVVSLLFLVYYLYRKFKK
ncbi:DUF4126 domain-containing protein [Flavobacterium sp. GCM10027622]|uniref:DUF4126 domain-containing protein n=1 Tax=unclassified Flavobacterium TaxID=196869 RepID=UPI003610D558